MPGAGEVDASSLHYASEMMEFLLWDPSVEGLPRFPLCSIPVEYTVDSLEVLSLVGRCMGPTVKTLIFDNASSHKYLKAMLLGLPHDIPAEKLERMEFWPRIVYVDFPASSLPRWPYRKPTIDGEVMLLVSIVVHFRHFSCF